MGSRIELHALDVERHVLLRFPANHLPGVRLLHPIHLDLLDDHVVAAHGRDHPLAPDTRLLEEPLDGVGHQTGIHHLPLHDRVGEEGTHRHEADLGQITRVIHLDHLHESAPDVEADRGPFPSEEGHLPQGLEKEEQIFPRSSGPAYHRFLGIVKNVFGCSAESEKLVNI